MLLIPQTVSEAGVPLFLVENDPVHLEEPDVVGFRDDNKLTDQRLHSLMTA